MSDERLDNPLLRIALSMYTGEACRRCGIVFDTVESLKDAVYAGPYEAGQSRVMHKACWQAHTAELQQKDA